MSQFWGAVGLALTGIIIADLMIHPEGVKAAGSALQSNLQTTFGAMLGGGR